MEQKNTASNSRFIAGITLVATLGGLLFGYDTAVISGAIGSVQTYFELDAIAKGWAASSALVGCILGASMAGSVSNRFGRKIGLIIGAILFFVSAIGTALPESFTIFIAFRIIGGVGVGIASMLSPMYIAEIAPPKIRGRLVSFNQLAIVFGILLVYFVNYYIALQDTTQGVWLIQKAWRWMFASEAIPALIFFALLFLVPESPRWLVMQGKTQQAQAVLERIVGRIEADREMTEIHKSLDSASKNKASLSDLTQKSILTVALIGVVLSILQQVTGINVIFYYAPEIFKKLGSDGDTALLETIIVGAVNMTFTVVAILTVDKWGRKPLLMVGSIGMAICLIALGFAFYTENMGVSSLIFILGYIACFAMSWGPVTWVLLSEIFPNRVRDLVMGIAVAAQWISNFLVSLTFPVMLDNQYLESNFHGAFPFWLYGLMCVISIWFNWKFVPETKGKTLEEMEILWEK